MTTPRFLTGFLLAAACGLAASTARAQDVAIPSVDGDPIVHDDQGREEIVVDFDDSAPHDEIVADARAAGVTLVANSFSNPATTCTGRWSPRARPKRWQRDCLDCRASRRRSPIA